MHSVSITTTWKKELIMRTLGKVYNHAHQAVAFLSDYFEGCELEIEAVCQLGNDTRLNAFNCMDHVLNIAGVGLECPKLLQSVIMFSYTLNITPVWTFQK